MSGKIKETLKHWLEKKGVEKWFQRDNFIILILSGILLFIIALPAKEDNRGNKEKAETKNKSRTEAAFEETGENNGGGAGLSGMEGNGENPGEEDYCAWLEKRLADIISQTAGAGKVKVMITLKSSEELVVEKDKPVSRSSTNEQDAQGGSRVTNQADTPESTVYSTRNGESEPYVVKTLLPQVEGVVVVAKGAGGGSVNKTITEIVQALFDIEAHKIKVVKMESTN